MLAWWHLLQPARAKWMSHKNRRFFSIFRNLAHAMLAEVSRISSGAKHLKTAWSPARLRSPRQRFRRSIQQPIAPATTSCQLDFASRKSCAGRRIGGGWT
jgi:hypothetical protein